MTHPHRVTNGKRDEVAVTSASQTDVQASNSQVGSRRRRARAPEAYVAAAVDPLTSASLCGSATAQRGVRWTPATMHRTDPPASSMVGMWRGNSTADRSITARCSSVNAAAARVVVHLKAAANDGPRFKVKDYPKDKEWRQVKLAAHLLETAPTEGDPT